MRIIIYDNNPNDMELFCSYIKLLPTNVTIDKLVSYEDFIDIYNRHKYDIVFIDYNDTVGIKIREYLIAKNSSQKIVIINNSFECSDPLGCEHCKANTKNYRIFKPYSIKDILNSFRDKKCELNYCDDTIETILHIISKSFNELIFDKENFVFTFTKRIDNSHVVKDLVKLTDMLSVNNIKYELIDTTIKVLES